MRVLLVSSHGADRTCGGAERYVAELAQHLEAQAHDVELLSAFPVNDASAGRTQVLHDGDWRHSRLRRNRNHVGDWAAVAWSRFEEILVSTRPTVVHTNTLAGIGTGIWERARRLGIPVVHTLHDYHLLCPRTTLLRRDLTPCRPSPYLCGLRTRRLARWAPGVQVVIGVSNHILARHARVFPSSTQRCVSPPPLVPVGDLIAPQASTSLNTVGFLGSLTSTKGIGTVLEAAPALASRGITLRIAGDGPLRAAVEAAEHVDYQGHVSGHRRIEFLHSCDAGLVPSLWDEPAGYVALEWQAAARPVLATGRAGLLDAASRGGVHLFDGSASGLIKAVDELGDAMRWEQTVESLPTVDGTRDLDRWIAQHLTAYQTSIASGQRHG